jgi:hypothetical protein
MILESICLLGLKHSFILKLRVKQAPEIKPHANSGHQRDHLVFVVAEAKLTSIVYFFYTWPDICTVQLI